MSTGTMERTHEQRMDALRRANVVRGYRAELKRSWRPRGGGVPARSARDVLSEPVEVEESWKVLDVLLAMPKVGRVKANAMLSRGRMSPAKTVGGLSGRQRRELLALLPVTR